MVSTPFNLEFRVLTSYEGSLEPKNDLMETKKDVAKTLHCLVKCEREKQKREFWGATKG